MLVLLCKPENAAFVWVVAAVSYVEVSCLFLGTRRVSYKHQWLLEDQLKVWGRVLAWGCDCVVGEMLNKAHLEARLNFICIWLQTSCLCCWRG